MIPKITITGGGRTATIRHHVKAKHPTQRYRVAFGTADGNGNIGTWASFPTEAWDAARRYIERADQRYPGDASVTP